MVVRPYGLRACAAMLFSAVVLSVGVGCHKSSTPTPDAALYLDVKGTITFTKVPLNYVDGVPTGLETNDTKFISAPARSVSLRFLQLMPQTRADYQVDQVWVEVGNTLTGTDGTYSLPGIIKKDYPTIIELSSLMTQQVAPGSTISIIADANGIYSQQNITDRPIYVIRKALDGTNVAAGTLSSLVPKGSANVTVDFAVKLNDPWTVSANKWWVPATGDIPVVEAGTVPAGSRVLGILDAFYNFAGVYGNALPTSSSSPLDIHYRPGLSTRRGTFIEYTPQIFPKAYDGSQFHYMGSVSGGGTVDGIVRPDDAFDTGVLYPILGRNFLFAQRKNNIVPSGVPATSLAPDLAIIEGLGDAMAATLLQSPYLAGSAPGNHYAPPRDIRVLTGLDPAEISAFSAPAITALVWDMALVTTAITSPGTSTDWAKISAIGLLKIYMLNPPVRTSGTATLAADVANIYTQLARLQEDKTSADTIELKTFFPDTVLAPLCAKYHIAWTTQANAILPKYTTNWGIDPDTQVTPLPGFFFKMDLAKKTKRYFLDAGNVEQVVDYYPNNSKDEVCYAMCAFSLDHTYNLKVTTNPVLPEGAAIEVMIDADKQKTFLFNAQGPAAVPMILAGNPGDLTTPAWHYFRIRMLSPDNPTPTTQVTINLEKTN